MGELMPRRARYQTRRAITISAATYDRIRAHCKTKGLAMSAFLETLIKEKTGESDGHGQS